MASGTSRRRRTKNKPEQAEDAGVAIDDSLHLPSLSIRGFRGIKELEIPRLARVTLLAGDNNVGKTTVLEAVRLYSEINMTTVMALIRRLLLERGELVESVSDENEYRTFFNRNSLFYGRILREGQQASISATQEYPQYEQLLMENSSSSGSGLRLRRGRDEEHEVTFDYLSRQREPNERAPAVLKIGPNIRTHEVIAAQLKNIILSPEEDFVRDSLRIAFGFNIAGMAVKGGTYFETAERNGPERVIVKLDEYDELVPIQSLGDGASRFLDLAMALIRSKNNLLLIDEAENGIHYSRHEAYWQMVIETAVKHNIQVLATTHSFDCIRGFSRAAALEQGNSMLVRLSQQEEGMLAATTYTEDLLTVAADMGIEVR